MTVRELMTGAVISAPPWMPMLDARALMMLGIVTDRDIRLNLPSRATSLSVWETNHLLSKLMLDEVMTRGVITVGPDRPARDAAQLMLEHQIGALPVEERGRLVGIVSETDMLRAFMRLETPLGAGRA